MVAMKKACTDKQGQYLAFIYYYTKIHGRPPAEAEMQQYFRVLGVVHRRANGTENSQASIDREFVLVAIVGDRQTIDELHDKVWKTISGAAAVQHFRDVGLVEAGENLSLIAKACRSEFARARRVRF